MPVKAIRPDYHGEHRDARANFGGAILVYIDWDFHRWFCTPKAFPLPPDMPFGALIEAVIPEGFGQHPQFSEIDWSAVEWTLDHSPFTPDMEKGIEEQGFGHKCILRFSTPDLIEAI